MPFELSYEPVPAWPTLAWVATCETKSNFIHIMHGEGVECRPDWFCEAVWNSAFAQGDFDQTDLVFGSGGRSRESAIIFVSAGSVVDRLQYATLDNRTLVSNSLAALMQAIDARLDPGFRGYDEFFEQINRGIDQQFPDLPIVGGRIGFSYFHNLLWDGSRLRRNPKPSPRRDFGTFEKYTGFLRDALQRIGENMLSPSRKRPLRWLGTISRGYDSATCSALAREAGLQRVITHDESRPGTRDDGLAIARALNLDCEVVDRLAWKALETPEILFLAADAQGKEVMTAALTDLESAVFVTGQAGGLAWGKEFKLKGLPPGPAGDVRESMPRTWHSGLSLTEYRLHAGFIHFPVPFMGLRQLPDLLNLSNSPEMAPWDIGGEYNRPIARRVLEEAAVPRNMFGMSKTGASIRFLRGEDAWSARTKRSFFRWLRHHGPAYGLSPKSLLKTRALMIGLETALLLRRKSPRPLSRAFRRIAARLARQVKTTGLNDLAFVWAMDMTRKSYRQNLI